MEEDSLRNYILLLLHPIIDKTPGVNAGNILPCFTPAELLEFAAQSNSYSRNSTLISWLPWEVHIYLMVYCNVFEGDYAYAKSTANFVSVICCTLNMFSHFLSLFI